MTIKEYEKRLGKLLRDYHKRKITFNQWLEKLRELDCEYEFKNANAS